MSSNLIALAFVGQMSRLGVAFYAFALILLPVLAFLGIVTFLRLVQSSLEDIACAHRIGLLRDFYLRLTPELEPHLVAIRGQRSVAPSVPERLGPGAWQLAFTAAGMVAVINSVVVAACAGCWSLRASTLSRFHSPAGDSSAPSPSSLQERRHCRARDAYRPEAVDLAAILIAPSPRAEDSP